MALITGTILSPSLGIQRRSRHDSLGFMRDSDCQGKTMALYDGPLKGVVPRDGDLPQHEAKVMSLFDG
eukprot:scaffold210997_cov30-Cyclotella_meneghiniana.AAC.1